MAFPFEKKHGGDKWSSNSAVVLLENLTLEQVSLRTLFDISSLCRTKALVLCGLDFCPQTPPSNSADPDSTDTCCTPAPTLDQDNLAKRLRLLFQFISDSSISSCWTRSENCCEKMVPHGAISWQIRNEICSGDPGVAMDCKLSLCLMDVFH